MGVAGFVYGCGWVQWWAYLGVVMAVTGGWVWCHVWLGVAMGVAGFGYRFEWVWCKLWLGVVMDIGVAMDVVMGLVGCGDRCDRVWLQMWLSVVTGVTGCGYGCGWLWWLMWLGVVLQFGVVMGYGYRCGDGSGCVLHRDSVLLQTPYAASITVTSVTFPHPSDSAFAVPPLTDLGQLQVRMSSYWFIDVDSVLLLPPVGHSWSVMLQLICFYFEIIKINGWDLYCILPHYWVFSICVSVCELKQDKPS